MSKTRTRNISPLNQSRLKKTGTMLKEMRFSEGKNQDQFTDFGVSRRQIQRGESGCNISLISLYKLIDVYGYSLDEFFKDME